MNNGWKIVIDGHNNGGVSLLVNAGISIDFFKHCCTRCRGWVRWRGAIEMERDVKPHGRQEDNEDDVMRNYTAVLFCTVERATFRGPAAQKVQLYFILYLHNF